jgi:hypothetical protein
VAKAEPKAVAEPKSLETQIDEVLASLYPVGIGIQEANGKAHPYTTKELEAELQELTSRAQLIEKAQAAAKSSGNSDDAKKVLELTEALRNRTTYDAHSNPVIGLLAASLDSRSGSKVPVSDSMLAILPYDGGLLQDTMGLIVDNAKNLDEILVSIHPEMLRAN